MPSLRQTSYFGTHCSTFLTVVYNHREQKELNKEEGLRERMRNQVFKWSRHFLYHARRYTGGKGKEGAFWRRKEIRQDHIMH
eukprot:6214347-Pleurochrysis_carterae.AAC.4